MNSSPLKNCCYNINNELPEFVEINAFVTYCINPNYRKDWFFNKDIISFINKGVNDTLQVDGEVLAFKC